MEIYLPKCISIMEWIFCLWRTFPLFHVSFRVLLYMCTTVLWWWFWKLFSYFPLAIRGQIMDTTDLPQISSLIWLIRRWLNSCLSFWHRPTYTGSTGPLLDYAWRHKNWLKRKGLRQWLVLTYFPQPCFYLVIFCSPPSDCCTNAKESQVLILSVKPFLRRVD